ncbi:T9SS type A sorting domain-containing protein [Flavobacterium caseinilyticum]|nr:T9SS type A sorting domain-containing protein [Flavobacterium caseinilyticum]
MVTPTFTDSVVTITGCLRSQTRTWNATDACGNAAAPVSRTATWTVDITPPTLILPAVSTADCGTIPVFGIPTVSDGCDSNPVINDLGIIITNNPDGSVTYTKTWSATDACGNTSTPISQTIIVLACNEGCTLGYWKNHTDRWCSEYSTSMLFGTVFVNAPSNLANLTLLQALNLGGGGINNLARQGVAALLNACHDDVDYPAPYLNNPQSVIDAVNAAYLAGGDAPGKLATKLDTLNNSGCPLGGTPATKNNDVSVNDSVGFTAYPVPFKDVLTIRCDFNYTSDVKIEVFNSQGHLVLSKSEANCFLNKEIMLHLHTYRGQEQVYLVKVTTNRGSTVKKVISSK